MRRAAGFAGSIRSLSPHLHTGPLRMKRRNREAGCAAEPDRFAPNPSSKTACVLVGVHVRTHGSASTVVIQNGIVSQTYMSDLLCDPAFFAASHGPHDMRPLRWHPNETCSRDNPEEGLSCCRMVTIRTGEGGLPRGNLTRRRRGLASITPPGTMRLGAALAPLAGGTGEKTRIRPLRVKPAWNRRENGVLPLRLKLRALHEPAGTQTIPSMSLRAVR